MGIIGIFSVFFETEFGKITTVICYDLSFQMLMNWVGFKHPDIVFAPSRDYLPVAEFQTKQTKFRAIENGFNVVKTTFAGISLFVDFNGRVLNYFHSRDTEDFIFISSIYTHGRKTLYSFIGIWWNYLYIVVAIIIFFVKPRFDFSVYRNYHPVQNTEENYETRKDIYTSDQVPRDVQVVQN